MNIQFDVLVMLPELILAIGAMALLLVGAIGGEKTAPIVSGAAIALLVASGAAIVLGTPGPAFHGAFLADVSNAICNEVKGVNRVCYDISSKPPATIEWE